MNNNTPRTDGFLLNTSNFMLKDEVIPFARQLERELNEAKKQLSDWQACARELAQVGWLLESIYVDTGKNEKYKPLQKALATFNALNQKKV
jgi:hypothetical protein